MRFRLTSLAAAALALALQCGAALAQTADVTVFAAASLKNALDAIVAKYQSETGKRVAVSYAATSALARQIEQGAPADIFLSADLDWMDYLQAKSFIKTETRRSLLGNRIVLVAPVDRAKPIELKPGALGAALGDGRLAIGSVASVPAGKYGKAALEKLGLWGEVSGKLAEAENVRAALVFVSRGEAPLGLVYETDAKADPKVAIVARFPETSHPPIVYPVALTASSRSETATDFLRILRSPASAETFAREGFTMLD
jgi:molybdate transport system substrate-binding protein